MRSSRSSKGQPKWRLKAAPTLLLPAPIKPTRTMARTPETDADFVVSDGPPGRVLIYGGNLRHPHGPSSPSLSLGFNGSSSTLLEVDFTTEGKQPDRRCCLVHRTCEGTPCPHYERCVFGFQKKVVFHFAPDRPRRHVNRGIVGSAGLDISAVTGEHIFAAIAEIALITDFSAGRIDLHQQSTHRVQYHIAADGRDFHMSVADIVQTH